MSLKKIPEPAVFFRHLRKSLLNALEHERKAKLENDAKIDIVMNQKILDYGQFSELVKAADLRVLGDKTQLASSDACEVDQYDLIKLRRIIEKRKRGFVCGSSERLVDVFEINEHQIRAEIEALNRTEKEISSSGEYAKKYCSLKKEQRSHFLESTIELFVKLFRKDTPFTELVEDCLEMLIEGGDEKIRIAKSVMKFIVEHPRSKIVSAFIGQGKQIVEEASRTLDGSDREFAQILLNWAEN